MISYELKPNNGQKSFYGKAVIVVEKGVETLYSYNTPIIKRLEDGTLIRLFDDWTSTTGKHIKSFCGLNKSGFFAVQYEAPKRKHSDLTPNESLQIMLARRYAH